MAGGRRGWPRSARQLLLLLALAQTVERYQVVQSGRSLWEEQERAESAPPEDLFAVMQAMVPPTRALLTESFAQTYDGAILRVFRLTAVSRRSRGDATAPRRVAFVQHALLDSSLGWLLLGPNNSLPFMLLDAGFDDVFLGNLRGNRFSRNSTVLDPDKDAKFWEFSYDHHAEHDIPAMIIEALRVSGAQNLQYIGFSQGSLVLLAGLSSRPELAAAVRSAVLLAPAVFVGHITSLPLRTLAKMQTAELFERWGVTEFGAYNKRVADLSSISCAVLPKPCIKSLQFLCGANPNGNLKVVDKIMRYLPAGTSTQNMAHWAQAVQQAGAGPTGLRKFDYGTACPPSATSAPTAASLSSITGSCNQAKYGQQDPPAYNFSTLITPLVIFSGGHDSLADPVDVQLLLEALPHRIVHATHQLPDYAHLDFSLGDDAHVALYPSVIAALGDLDLRTEWPPAGGVIA